MDPLFAGVLMLLGAGLGWAVIGTLLSYLARRRIPATAALMPQILVAIGLAWAILPDYGILAESGIATYWPIVALMFGGGIVNGVGVLAMQHTMRTGHTSIVWAIGQSALVFPFLAGLVFFHETATALRMIGIGTILAALMIYASTRNTNAHTAASKHPINKGNWFGMALSVMLILGIAQTVMSLPSHLPSLRDPARLRVPCFYLGYGLVYLAVWARRPVRPKRQVLGFAVVCGVIAVSSTLLLFLALDRLAKIQMVSVGFPIGIGASILFYTVYSISVLREPFTIRHAIGMIANLGGLVAVAASS